MSTKDRADSIDTIPDVDFIAKSLEEEVVNSNPEVSEFKMKELKNLLEPEPFLLEDKSRFVLFPIKHGDVRYL
jgi:hypothetical protein